MDISHFKNIIWDYTRKINENTNNALNPICEQYGLTMLQVRILMEICSCEAHTIGSLAEGTCIAGANISTMCKKLESMELVKRVRDREDERVVKVALTEKGNDIVLNIDRALSQRIMENMNDEMEETLKDIIKGLEKLNELLQKIVSDNQ